MLRKKSGSLFVGRFVSVKEPYVLHHSAAHNKGIQMHDLQSFRELVEEVRHGMEWPVRVEVEEFADERGLDPRSTFRLDKSIKFALTLA